MRPEATETGPRPRGRRGKRAIEVVALLVVAVGLFATWPKTLGGRVSYLMVSGHSMEPTMHTGDVAVLRSAASYHVGEIIAYRVREGDVGGGTTVIHRIVGGNARVGYTTRGDNNDYDDLWHPTPKDIQGVRWALLPRAGSAFAALRAPLVLALFAGLLGAAIAYSSRRVRAASTGSPRTRRASA